MCLSFFVAVCQDVDECGNSTINDCQQQCNNTPGRSVCAYVFAETNTLGKSLYWFLV